jgi:hypothetical protein
MGNNTSITPDLINRRLGGGGQKTFYEPELPTAYDDQPEGSRLSAGFMVMMLVLFVAVGGGTYFVASSDYSWYEFKHDIDGLSNRLSQFQL